jgi:hypothetical protein
MSKHNRLPNGRNKTDGQWVRLAFYLIDSPAWRDLDPTARALYVELKRRFNGKNNGSIGYGIRQAADNLRVGKSTAARAFQSLKEHGFIIPALEGTFNRKSRHSSEWLLTEYPADIDIDDPTTGLRIKAYDLARKDFARWHIVANSSQQTGPVAGLTGPVVGPIGPLYGTVPVKKAAHGI